MDEVNEIVLESAVVILSGGVDMHGVSLITFPVDSADLLDIYSSTDILKLMQVFVDLCAGDVAVVADLKHGWTEDCIEKLTYLLDELQITRRGCLKTAYIVRPCVKTKKSYLHRQLSRGREKGRAFPHYDVKRVEHLDDLYRFIEKSQLTVDYGGTMQYNHIAWVDFQRTYIPVIVDSKNAIQALATIRNEISRLKTKDSRCFEICHDEELMKYQILLSQFKVRESMSNCQDAIEKLEHPECDPNLIQTHSAILVDTLDLLKRLHLHLTNDLANMDAIMKRSNAEHAAFIKLEECNDNTSEVEETIELMMQQVTDLPLVGTSMEEAQTYRNHFIDTILLPSKDIVSCGTSILQDIACGKETTPKSYAFAVEIAKRLTDALQPFTQYLNELNEKYIRIHLFHVILNKTERWMQKATYFLTATLRVKEIAKSKEQVLKRTVDKTCAESTTNEGTSICQIQVKQKTALYVDLDSNKNTDNKIPAPSNWETLLQRFNKKHPPPKKRHIRLLNKFVPDSIHVKQRNKSEIIAERVLFILQMMKKTLFKAEDIKLIKLWSDQIVDVTTHDGEVTLV